MSQKIVATSFQKHTVTTVSHNRNTQNNEIFLNRGTVLVLLLD